MKFSKFMDKNHIEELLSISTHEIMRAKPEIAVYLAVEKASTWSAN